MLGVLIDTFIVRGLLVPSIVLVLKDWNWWPSKRRGHKGSFARDDSFDPRIG
jgi:RND superfamily putative drug exporter